MARPTPTPILHFTHISHLASIAEEGLACDTDAQDGGLLMVEVGNRSVKGQRRAKVVPCEPGGVVADYVPFYFAPRSPMMFAIDRGRVPEYTDGCDPLVYLVTSVEELSSRSVPMVFTDGNAATGITEFSDQIADLDNMVDWPLMKERYWADTLDDGDRRRRRMAECLAVGPIPWPAFHEVVVRTEDRSLDAVAILDTIGVTATIRVAPDWYF